MDFHYSGILGVIILVLDIYAIVNTLGSHKRTISKVFWVAIIILLPLLGFIFWLLFGPRVARL